MNMFQRVMLNAIITSVLAVAVTVFTMGRSQNLGVEEVR